MLIGIDYIGIHVEVFLPNIPLSNVPTSRMMLTHSKTSNSKPKAFITLAP